MITMPNAQTGPEQRALESIGSAGSGLNRKFWIAMALYAAVALLVWFTMDAGKVVVWGKAVESEAGSADCDRGAGVAYGVGPAGGEDPPERRLLAFSYRLSASGVAERIDAVCATGMEPKADR